VEEVVAEFGSVKGFIKFVDVAVEVAGKNNAVIIDCDVVATVVVDKGSKTKNG
jgi:hypothetical protein